MSPSISAAVPRTGEWLNARAALQLLGWKGHSKLYRIALAGRIRTRALPGESLRFHRADLESLITANERR